MYRDQVDSKNLLDRVSTQSVGSSTQMNWKCYLVLITGTSQSRQHDKSESDSYYLSDYAVSSFTGPSSIVDTSLIHIESRKSPTTVLVDAHLVSLRTNGNPSSVISQTAQWKVTCENSNASSLRQPKIDEGVHKRIDGIIIKDSNYLIHSTFVCFETYPLMRTRIHKDGDGDASFQLKNSRSDTKCR
ncbi:hypothetical protein Tco_1507244 [Tanacetum coccineum]